MGSDFGILPVETSGGTDSGSCSGRDMAGVCRCMGDCMGDSSTLTGLLLLGLAGLQLLPASSSLGGLEPLVLL